MHPDSITQHTNEGSTLTKLRENILTSVQNHLDSSTIYTQTEKSHWAEKLRLALELVFTIHSDQIRYNGEPYLYHILRVTNRIIEDYDIYDPEIIIAALLHDSVEDQAKKLARLNTWDMSSDQREKAINYIMYTFGDRVARIISKLTNPKHITNESYAEHVRVIIEDPDVLPIKLSDFTDNGMNLTAITDVSRRLKLSDKYLPVIRIFIDRINRDTSVFSREKRTEILQHLESAARETMAFISTTTRTQ